MDGGRRVRFFQRQLASFVSCFFPGRQSGVLKALLALSYDPLRRPSADTVFRVITLPLPVRTCPQRVWKQEEPGLTHAT
eukprot:1049777-Pyramimonas_sp.AAC.1